MSLPQSFDAPEKYFVECLQFLKDYQYLYIYPNTDILIHNVLDKITIADETIVCDKNFDITAEGDEYLHEFFSKLKKVQVFYDDFQEDPLDENVNVPLSVKKKHEIVYLSRQIKESCENIGCEVVVDFGSGLGYLDQLIYETTNLKVLGIECNENHYVGAKKRQRKYHANSTDNVKYIKHTVSEESHQNILDFLEDKFKNRGDFCITGLHACADLTIDAINLFLKLEDAKAMVIMPCCYHKMVNTKGMFKNFPLSGTLKNIFERLNGEEFVNVPFLRLAAQPPSVEEKLEDLVFNLMSRAVLQLFAFKRNCKLKRNKRKAVKTKTMENNFKSYIEDATTNGFTLIRNDPLDYENTVTFSSSDVEELIALWNLQSEITLKKAAIFILLQNHLQPVIENLILYDRLIYLKENCVNNCKFLKILNEKISPRCLALVAYKTER